ncbi:unnamed protein product [Clonostachys solani]|uniref:Alpha-L-arabinofuranosidase n=1 Tax=Clonostachys solani TaxID=160281 RepID=A0A9N9W9H5_9HYPO|nr:unnamed protein product [Clonostachys solani]
MSMFALVLAATASFRLAAAAPCDIYASGGTPCIAAHGTTRALYSSYEGPLYQVKRASDNAVLDVSPLAAGGVADADAQDNFCASTTCLITVIYDQSGVGNHLTQAPPGYFHGPDVDGYDNLASAIGAPVSLNGRRAYGAFVAPGTGYRNNNAVETAIGDEPQGMYAVLDGTHYNDACCFDYGNAEPSGLDTGNGHMETIYFGSCSWWGSGDGEGPWIMADLENGLFSGLSPSNNPGDPTISHRFTTSIVKGAPNLWAIRGGNAKDGKLSTFFEGERPSVDGYNPMSKEGAILLGIGGDNSNGGQGTFYEGVMTDGYPSAEIEDAVQADIVAAGYAEISLVNGPELTLGSSISFQATTACCTARYLSHTGASINTQVVDSSSSIDLKKQASWTVRAGLGKSECFSFESNNSPGSFIRHANFALALNADDGSKLFAEDATFCPQAGLSGQGSSIRSWSHPTRYFRHFKDVGYISSNGGVHDWDAAGAFTDDATWIVNAGFV